ncbi:MAG: GTPase, partial [Methylococcales bacterium]
VVAFFGGTGVGKSTLLNRLAGHEVARTGVVRPTSRDVSLYLYQDLNLDQLPENFPIEKVRITRHNNEDMKNVLWIDMPDIDSTETANRKIVLEWLPHIDILVYVVSPERYHDEKGWRLLLSEGAKHAWLFVMNHFDQGDSSRLRAFTGQLLEAGFKDPIVLATDCSRADSTDRDDFKQLENAIASLANRHTVERLELRALVSRLHEIEINIGICVDAMGSPEATGLVLEKWETIWSDAVIDLDEGIQWPIQEAARSLGIADGGKKLIKKISTEIRKEDQPRSPQSTNPILWDEWTQTRFDDALDQLAVTAGASGIPVAPFKNRLAEIRSQARKILHSQTELSLRHSLANPGNSIQRLLLNVTRVCSGLFPLTAIGWVAYEVLDQFHSSSTTGAPYLGLNFAIHSGLLIIVAWLLPWFVYKKIKPSTEEIALRALKNGTRIGYECIKSRIDDCLGNLLDQRSCLIDATEKIKRECQRSSSSEAEIENTTLSRMLSQLSLTVKA